MRLCTVGMSMLLLASTELTDVKLQLLPLEDVPVAATRLARPARDGGVQTTGTELCLDGIFELRV